MTRNGRRNLVVFSTLLVALMASAACNKPSAGVQAADAAPDDNGCGCLVSSCPSGAAFHFDIPTSREVLTRGRIRVCLNETDCVERALGELLADPQGPAEFYNHSLWAVFDKDGRRVRVSFDYEPVQPTDRFRVTIADEAGVHFQSATRSDVAVQGVVLNACSTALTHEACDGGVACLRADIDMVNEAPTSGAGLDASDSASDGDR